MRIRSVTPGVVLASLLTVAYHGQLGAQSVPVLHAVRVGALAGASFANVDGSGLSQISNRDGVVGGLTLGVGLANGWSFQSGALYEMKGWNHTESPSRDQGNVKLDYVEIPALLRYDFENTSVVTPYLEGGAGLSFRSACNLELVDGASGASQRFGCADIERLSGGTVVFHSFDTGVVGGGGLSLQVGRTALTASLRYEVGLMSVQKSPSARSRMLTLAAGISRSVGF